MGGLRLVWGGPGLGQAGSRGRLGPGRAGGWAGAGPGQETEKRGSQGPGVVRAEVGWWQPSLGRSGARGRLRTGRDPRGRPRGSCAGGWRGVSAAGTRQGGLGPAVGSRSGVCRAGAVREGVGGLQGRVGSLQLVSGKGLGSGLTGNGEGGGQAAWVVGKGSTAGLSRAGVATWPWGSRGTLVSARVGARGGLAAGPGPRQGLVW